MSRSIVVRDEKKKRGWKEMYDPVTFGFWYYNEFSLRNSWEAPLVFQKTFVCTWDGYKRFGALSASSKRCRNVFSNEMEYRGHMINAHKWYCPSCETKNTGLSFPKCEMCGNVLSEDGENAADAMIKHATKIDRCLDKFLKRDLASDTSTYSLRDRLVQVNVLMREEQEEEKRLQEELSAAVIKSPSGSVCSKANKKIQSRFPILVKQDSGQMQMDDLMKKVSDKKKQKKKVAEINPLNSREYFLERSMDVNLAQKKKDILNLPQTTPMMTKRISEMPPVALSDNVMLHGILDPRDFDEIVGDETYQDIPIEDDERSDSSTIESSVNTGTLSIERMLLELTGQDSAKNQLQVCKGFLEGECTLTTCPHAHPHIRDKAKLTWLRFPGVSKRLPFVDVCLDWVNQCCEHGHECEKYHTYIRPSTIDLIKKIYPIKAGRRRQVFKSGAVCEGNAKNDRMHGYATMAWTSGAVYMGDWHKGKRSGFGIFRSEKGVEYVGQWREGKKEGWGQLTHPNGEEYIGQWLNGNMHGVGRITSANGDAYEGEFKENKYDGFGIFKKQRGDIFMGFCKDGMAEGLGILALSTGEKYKGYFSRNSQHGKGVCAYRSGARYAGQWYRGLHEGWGIFICPPDEDGYRERYVGEWAAGKKHGTGRYFFKNGDFYDGQFRFNIAKGMGVYVHTVAGGIYKGEWDKDMRNGRGTYVFKNGSRYTGNWVDNQIHGKGKFDFNVGAYYRGEFEHNRKHGRGIFTWPNNNVYKGTFVNDILEGQGEMTYVMGHVYKGGWSNSKKNGYGVFTYCDGHVYAGEWVDDCREGQGKMTYLPGTELVESYEGSWKNDEKDGFGVYIYRKADGCVYEGDWRKNRRHGKGKLSFSDGSFYRGDFLMELMHGYGIHVSADGSQYEGEWFENMRHGRGTVMANDGTIYQGMFWRNKKHGEGVLEYPTGSQYKGEWEDGQIEGHGVVSFNCGDGSFGGPNRINVKVFGF